MIVQQSSKTHIGRVRDENQDAVLVLPGIGVYMVADGMGGCRGGRQAAMQVVKTVGENMQAVLESAPPGTPEELQSLIRTTLEQSNLDVLQIGKLEPQKSGLGSTASLLCLHRGLFFIGQVGDSRVYQFRKGTLAQLTSDHTVVWQMYEKGMINRAELETHPERHLLTQCVGSARPIVVDLFEGAAYRDDVFLICSDGLNGYVGEAMIFEIIGKFWHDLDGCAQKLVDAALAGGGGDNVSVVLARVDGIDASDDWVGHLSPEPNRLASGSTITNLSR